MLPTEDSPKGQVPRLLSRLVIIAKEEKLGADLAAKELAELSNAALVAVEAMTDNALLQPGLPVVALADLAPSVLLHRLVVPSPWSESYTSPSVLPVTPFGRYDFETSRAPRRAAAAPPTHYQPADYPCRDLLPRVAFYKLARPGGVAQLVRANGS